MHVRNWMDAGQRLYQRLSRHYHDDMPERGWPFEWQLNALRRWLARNCDSVLSTYASLDAACIEYARAVDCYIDSRKAVPVAEAYDSPVLQLALVLREVSYIHPS